MREIKVRGYAVDEMIGSQWIIGTGVHTIVFTDKYFEETGKKYEYFVFGEYGWVEVHGESVGQYTGLKDKNGTEIYEGDLTWDSHNEVVGRVTFDEGKFLYELTTTYEDLFEVCDEIEVIGNESVNPELLEVTE